MNIDIILEFNIDYTKFRNYDTHIYCTYDCLNHIDRIVKSNYIIIKDGSIYYVEIEHNKYNPIKNMDVNNLVDRYITIDSLLDMCTTDSLVCEDISRSIIYNNSKQSVVLINNDSSMKLRSSSRTIKSVLSKYTTLITIDDSKVVGRTRMDYDLLYYNIIDKLKVDE